MSGQTPSERSAAPDDSPVVVAESGSYRVRRATRADNARFCEVFSSVSMKADLHLAVDRAPDFFALYDMQRAERVSYALEVDEQVEGIATYLSRPAWIDGRLETVGYAGDLRLTPAARGGKVLPLVFGPGFRDARQALGCGVIFTAIITSNKRAVAALTGRQSRHEDMPHYHELRRFKIRNVQFTTAKPPRSRGITVRTATDADLAPLATLLAADHQTRPLGYAFDEALLRHRLARWPGLGLHDVYLAFDGGTLVGATATWDGEQVKRYRVLGYHRAMRWIRLAFNLAAPLGGFTPLPAAGGQMRYFYLTHLSVPGEQPDVMAALLERIYADKRSAGYHFFSACVLEDDPLGAAYQRFRCTDLPAALYAIEEQGRELPLDALCAGRPGFEMALV